MLSVFLSTPSARRATFSAENWPKTYSIFLSTPSARRATHLGNSCCCLHIDFYPRPPRGGRPSAAATVSITMPFLSTPSARRATPQWSLNRLFIFISIHALREEGDGLRLQGQTRPADFYPRPPRGGRPFNKRMRDEVGKFLSTPSARRATSKVEDWEKHMIISIHALREEGDLEAARNGPCLENFYPRPPRGGRPFRFALLYDDITISIHALREEGDARDLAGDNTNTISIHALREEGDPFVTGRSTVLMLFLSTPSARRATGR